MSLIATSKRLSFSSKICIILTFCFLNVSYSSPCIKPYNLKVLLGDEVHDLNLFQDKSGSTTADVGLINKFVSDHNLSDSNKISLLEAALNFISSHPEPSEKPMGPIYLSFETQDDVSSTMNRVEHSLDVLNHKDDYPVQMWSTSTIPSYKLCLYGDEEFISTEVRKRGSFGPMELIKQLIIKSREERAAAKLHYNATDNQGVVIDIGANIGTVAFYAAALGERVIAFEPMPAHARRLAAGCILNGWCTETTTTITTTGGTRTAEGRAGTGEVNDSNPMDQHQQHQHQERHPVISIVSKGAANTSSSAIITYDWHFIPPGGMRDVNNASVSSSSYLRNSGAATMVDILNHSDKFDETNLIGSNLQGAKQMVVETTTIDEVLLDLGLLPPLSGSDSTSQRPLPPISVLKLDCEGCEPGALQGASRMFAYNPPQYIITEVYSKVLLITGWSVIEYFDFWDRMGYDLYDGSLDRPIERNVKIVDKDGNVKDDADESFYAESYIGKRRNYPVR
eukprot:gene3527-7019_t